MPDRLLFVALWSEVDVAKGQLLHILTQDRHLQVVLPEIELNAKAIEEFLPELGQVAPKAESTRRWLLLLEPSLPQYWQTHRWEPLNLAGKPLSSKAMVIRRAVWRRRVMPESNSTSLLLNLFPATEYRFLSRLQSRISDGAIRICRTSFIRQQMAGVGNLIVLAHGRECGLIDPSGTEFELPLAHPMPERIWLLACNVSGAMDTLARQLIQHGSRTIVAATGELSAPAMAALVDRMFSFVPNCDAHSSWIVRLEAAIKHSDGALDLTVWGEIDIDSSKCATWNRITWDIEHGSFRRPPLDEETTKEAFFSALTEATSQTAWSLTRQWILPPLLWLAEVHHHPSMRQLSRLLGDSTSPVARLSLAAAARRVGNYVQTAKYLSAALSSPEMAIKERSECFGALANLFIDLNLPECAVRAIELHADCALIDPQDSEFADLKRLDWMARAEARRGRFVIALDYFTTKRKSSPFDSGRELSWQLYVSAWGQLGGQIPLSVSMAFADEAIAHISQLSVHEVGLGNETSSYLLRALAAHAWATGDSRHLGVLENWLTCADARLTDDDPGPWAYSIAYMYLLQAVPLATFDRAMSALERSRYYLEGSCFFALAERKENSIRLLKRFQNRRQVILHELGENVLLFIPSIAIEYMVAAATECEFNYLKGSAASVAALPL